MINFREVSNKEIGLKSLIPFGISFFGTRVIKEVLILWRFTISS